MLCKLAKRNGVFDSHVGIEERPETGSSGDAIWLAGDSVISKNYKDGLAPLAERESGH